jgi:membrane-associated phospholipid phosphatase
MKDSRHQPGHESEKSVTSPAAGTSGVLPQMPSLSPLPTVNLADAQKLAAQTSVSGRRAVSRGTWFLALYLWILSGVLILSWIAGRTQFFPGDRTITRQIQKNRNPWLRRFLFCVSQIGFWQWATPIVVGTAGIFWALRFRLEAIFMLLTSSSALLNAILKRVIKRPRPTEELVQVTRVINEPSFPSGHVMHYTTFYGLLIYMLATNWRSGKLRNALIGLCTALILCIGPSRVYLGAHWPSDAVAGYLYGGLWLTGLTALYLRVKSWLHPQTGKVPEIVKLLQQPGNGEESKQNGGSK